MIFAGNWKMNKNPDEAREFLKELSRHQAEWEPEKIVLFPPVVLAGCFEEWARDAHVQWGGQNCHWQAEGAFTGETSPVTLRSMGATHCLIGHSERRQLFGEKDHELARKVPAAQAAGLVPVICVGETLNERDGGKTEDVLDRQLRLDLEYVDFQKPFWIAYEPVWAIGTGRVASVEVVEKAHSFIRNWLVELNPLLRRTPILYGGSVKLDNVANLAKVAQVNGFLVGGASLKAEEFLGMIRIVLSQQQ